MDLQQFLRSTHSGAFFVWDNVISDLSINDLKALRLVLDPSLANAIFPYMFHRLFFSVHNEDLQVLEYVSEHPSASRKITQIFWEGGPGDFSLAGEIGDISPYNSECWMPTYIKHFLHDRGNEHGFYETYNLFQQQLDQSRRQKPLYLQATDFWLEREKAWKQAIRANTDLDILRSALSRLPNLRRINILSEEPSPCAQYEDYLRLWPTPRARSWAGLPFSQFLLTPRPKNPGKTHYGLIRALMFLSQFVQDGRIEVGSIIVDPYGRVRPSPDTGDVTTSDAQSFTIFDSIMGGYASTVSDIEKSHKLTIRVMIETNDRYGFLPDGWTDRNAWYPHLNTLILDCQHSLEEITYCRINMKMLIDEHQRSRSDTDSTLYLKNCTQLRRVRFHECWCKNAFVTLYWLWHNTTIREVELHSVASTVTSWYAVMMDLKEQGIVFNTFNVVSCRSPNELWGPGFAPEVLAPWNGESREIVPWLRGESDTFPLWQGPG